MSDFYKILKNTRIERGIELEEIQTRTKINIKFLNAIENGEFDLLPEPYIRLFLRAYSTEIGLDPKNILNEFEQYFNEKSSKFKGSKRNKIPEKRLTTPKFKSENKTIRIEKSPKINRGKIIKSIILLACWIFGLIIIHKITNSPNASLPPKIELSAKEFIIDLNTKYEKGDIEEHLLEFKPPFSLTIKTVSQLSVFTSSDSIKFSRIILNSGEHKPIYIDTSLTLILEHTQNVTLSIRGESEEITLDQSQNSLNPVKIKITGNPPTYSIRKYTQKQ